MWTVLHLIAYVALLDGVAQYGTALVKRKNSRRHRKCLERIARLEIETSIGLDWGREFFDKRTPKSLDYGLKRECWSCERAYYPDIDSRGSLREHLCGGCVRKTEAELSSL